jgi:hypothetical protein
MFFKKIVGFLLHFLLSQDKFTLSGTITDIKTNETLIGVNVYTEISQSQRQTSMVLLHNTPKANYTF